VGRKRERDTLAHTHTYTDMHTHAHTRTHHSTSKLPSRIHTHARTHTPTHTCTNTHTHTHTTRIPAYLHIRNPPTTQEQDSHTRSHTLTHAHTRSHALQSEGAEARSLGLPGRIDPDRATGVDFADRHVSERARMSARDHARARGRERVPVYLWRFNVLVCGV